jgi:hypothetical protein
MVRITEMPVATPSRFAAWFEALRLDTRYAVRGLRLHPGFSAMVVVTLALGIGANVTMFGILDRLLLRTPSHIVDAERVVQAHSRWLGRTGVQSSHPYAIYKDFLGSAPTSSKWPSPHRRAW